MLIHLVPNWCRSFCRRSEKVIQVLKYLQKGDSFPEAVWDMGAHRIHQLGNHMADLDWDLVDSLEEESIEKVDKLVVEITQKWGILDKAVNPSGWISKTVQQRQQEIPDMIQVLNEILILMQIHPSQNFK